MKTTCALARELDESIIRELDERIVRELDERIVRELDERIVRELDERIVRELDERTPYDCNSNRKVRTATGLKSCDACSLGNFSPLAAINPFDEVVETRICSLPTKAAADIYDKLGYRHYPFRKMKICSTQT